MAGVWILEGFHGHILFFISQTGEKFNITEWLICLWTILDRVLSIKQLGKKNFFKGKMAADWNEPIRDLHRMDEPMLNSSKHFRNLAARE